MLKACPGLIPGVVPVLVLRHYEIEVSGNTFVQTDGDAGSVTGAFFGSGHEVE